MSDLTVSPPRTPWWQHPLLAGVLLAVALVAIGDAYPLTPFPMYSRIDTSADMLFVTDQTDQPLPLSRIFNSGSAQLKKRFEKELQKQAGTKEYEKAEQGARRKAGEEFLKDLWEGRDKGDVAKLHTPPQTLTLKIRTMSMEGTSFTDKTHTIAALPVAPTEGGNL